MIDFSSMWLRYENDVYNLYHDNFLKMCKEQTEQRLISEHKIMTNKEIEDIECEEHRQSIMESLGMSQGETLKMVYAVDIINLGRREIRKILSNNIKIQKINTELSSLGIRQTNDYYIEDKDHNNYYVKVLKIENKEATVIFMESKFKIEMKISTDFLFDI